MARRDIKIVHVTVARRLSAGQRKQLRFEHTANPRMLGVHWTTIALHTEPTVESFERQIPRIFRPLFLRNLYAWFIVFKLARQNDFVMLRHITFDPFAFIFAPLISNRISVHHAKENKELLLIRADLRGKFASALERVAGRFAVRHARGVLGVTNEIAKYERDLHAPGKPCAVYPNGIVPDQIPLADDCRKSDEVHAAFICGRFSSWHGLDRLIHAVDATDYSDLTAPLRIHLIGELPAAQLKAITMSAQRRRVFCAHGSLAFEDYKRLLALCNTGLSSFAIDRKDLSEASTFKVRELLAMGIPVYSGHSDTSIPQGHPHYLQTKTPDIPELLSFSKEQRRYSRSEVREHSLPFISKRAAMEATATWLRNLKHG